MPLNHPIVKKSPAFAALLKRGLKEPADKRAYFAELARLAKERTAGTKEYRNH